ncbi:MAG: hypothetical protein ACOC5A_03575 [Halanaerobiales bacterium]
MLTPPLQPMLLTTEKKPFDSPEYFFEFKWDGFRCLAFINHDNLFLQSRNGNNLIDYFPALHKLPSLLAGNRVVLDGEICCITQDGKQEISLIQKKLRSKSSSHPATFITWDILHHDEEDTYGYPLKHRKKLLARTVKKQNSILQISPFYKQKGKKLFTTAEKENLEGIVAKKIDSPYQFKRSDLWKKIKAWKYTCALIGGYTERNSFLVGEKIENQLKYRGKVKNTLPEKERKALLSFLPRLEQKSPPFYFAQKLATGNDKIHWVDAKISCHIRYTELTPKGLFRHGYITDLIYDTTTEEN